MVRALLCSPGMSRRGALRALVVVSLMAGSAWLGRLSAAAPVVGLAPADEVVAPASSSSGDEPRVGRRPPRARALLPLPVLPSTRAADWRQERRDVQAQLAALLGRGPDESAEAYRARLAPLVRAFLAAPRQRVAGWRAEAERVAGLGPVEHAAIDAIVADAHAEALALTNAAVATGELTPYARNVTGTLAYAGGLGAVLAGAEVRLAAALDEPARRALAETGFDFAEYLALTTPWEALDPPPPSP
jgi:hypothetical protein